MQGGAYRWRRERMKVIVTGASGLLGADIAAVFAREHEVVALKGRKELDLTDAQAVLAFMQEMKPDLIINCAGFRMVDMAEEQRRMTFAINTFGAKNAALAAARLDIPLIHISSDSVFDGETKVPYHEYDKTNPINTYGQSKLMAESEVRAVHRKHFIIRVPLLFGAKGYQHSNYIYMMMEKLDAGETVSYTTDQMCSPTYCRDVAEELLNMAQTPYYGTYHIANTGIASRYEFYSACALGLGYSVNRLVPILQKDRSAKRAKNTMFDSIAYTNTFHRTLRGWKEALGECLEEIKEQKCNVNENRE